MASYQIDCGYPSANQVDKEKKNKQIYQNCKIVVGSVGYGQICLSLVI